MVSFVDVATCTDCGRQVEWVGSVLTGNWYHSDDENLLAYGVDGHLVHEDKLPRCQATTSTRPHCDRPGVEQITGHDGVTRSFCTEDAVWVRDAAPAGRD